MKRRNNKVKKNRFKNNLQFNLIIALIVELILTTIITILKYLYRFLSIPVDFLYEIFSYSIFINILVISILIGVLIFLIFKFRKRKLVILLILFLFAIPIAFITLQTYNLFKLSNKTVIVIAEFDDSKATTKVDISKRIYDSIKTEKGKLDLESLQIEKIPIIVNSIDEAQNEGNKGTNKNAKTIIFIWGWYDDLDVKTFFTIVKSSKKEIISKSVELEKAKGLTISDIENFDLEYFRKTLPDAMVFLTDFTLGLVYYYEEDFENAIFQFNSSLKKIPEDEEIKEFLIDIYFYKANSYFNLEDFVSAENNFKFVISLDPNYTIAHNNLGILLLSLNRLSEAEEEFKETIRLNPNLAIAHNNLGILLLSLNRFSEAEEEFKEAIKLDPNLPGAHNNLGVLLHDLDRFSEAEEEYIEAIRLDPNYAGAHNNLGVLLHDLDRLSEAEKEFREGIRLDPYDARAHYSFGVLLCDLNKLSEAEDEFRKVIILDPNYTIVHGDLGLLLWTSGRTIEAEEHFNILIKSRPDLKDWVENVKNIK